MAMLNNQMVFRWPTRSVQHIFPPRLAKRQVSPDEFPATLHHMYELLNTLNPCIHLYVYNLVDWRAKYTVFFSWQHWMFSGMIYTYLYEDLTLPISKAMVSRIHQEAKDWRDEPQNTSAKMTRSNGDAARKKKWSLAAATGYFAFWNKPGLCIQSTPVQFENHLFRSIWKLLTTGWWSQPTPLKNYSLVSWDEMTFPIE